MGKRLFVSVDLDGPGEAVAAVQELFEGASGLNFTDPEQAHVTLKFLGDIPDHRVDAVTETLAAAVDAADVDPFIAEFAGLGVFPTLEYISVVWLGVEAGGEQLTRLHEAIEPRTVDLGFEIDSAQPVVDGDSICGVGGRSVSGNDGYPVYEASSDTFTVTLNSSDNADPPPAATNCANDGGVTFAFGTWDEGDVIASEDEVLVVWSPSDSDQSSVFRTYTVA